MKNWTLDEFKIIIGLILLFGLGSFFLVSAAITAPTIVFSGDDILQNGGNDDPYDALIQLDIASSQVNPDIWELEYSNDAGESWLAIIANYTVVSAANRQYYWSVSKIYAPQLLIRIRTQQAGEWSDYYQTNLSLSHRVTNHNAHYFVEDFSTTDFQGENNRINWDTSWALVELGPNPPAYHPNGTVQSTNLLAGLNNNDVLSVIFQPVLWSFTKTIRFQVSNNGLNWYGDTTGVAKDNVWFNFGDTMLPDPVTVPFNSSIGNGLYFKISLATNNTDLTPQVFQLRFFWQENSNPTACFIINPNSSQDPEENYIFNANCSTDYEDSLNQLFFRWDFDNNGAFETAWQTGSAGYLKTYNYHSTSTFVAKLEVKDSNGAVSSFTNSLNESGVEGAVSGWLWSSNYGWTSLNCDNVYYGVLIESCQSNYGWTLNPDYTMSGWAWDSNLGWLCIVATCQPYGLTPDNEVPVAVYSRDTGEVVGWGKYLIFGESGWLKLRGNWCGEAEDQCVHVNMSQRSLEGWAWAGGQTPEGVSIGPGWVQFEGSLNVPWLETKFGSVYGRNDFGSSETLGAPQDRYNASYCILASGSIINLSSEINCLEADYRDLGFPGAGNSYKNILGMIDFGRILNGNQLVFADADIDANLPRDLAGQVYYFQEDDLNSFTIDNPITFYNARNLNSSGAGTVVVDGDLHINNNMYYEDNPVSGKIGNLASVAWIVKGDLIIDPAVTNLVGNFIVLGRDGVACPTDGCGRFLTGDDSGNNRQLVLQGLAMSKSFSLQRYYKAGGEPAEKFIYDGRVLVNTPPGLDDFAKGLPVWREALPTNQIE